jgi:Flp pilus assembly pilin Flp
MNILRKIWSDDAGQDVIEYALMAGLISVIAYAAIKATGNAVGSLWNVINADVASAT